MHINCKNIIYSMGARAYLFSHFPPVVENFRHMKIDLTDTHAARIITQ